MKRFIFVSIIFMGWAFYELSGGADFKPDARLAEKQAAAAARKANDVVTRAAITPSVADLTVARMSNDTAVNTAPVDEPAAAARKPDAPKLQNIGQGTLKVLALTTPAPDAIPQPQQASATAGAIAPAIIDVADWRVVTGNRVNMRNGPGTEYSVVERLQRGDRVEVLQDPGTGWVKLKVEYSGRVGWMADFLLATPQ